MIAIYQVSQARAWQAVDRDYALLTKVLGDSFYFGRALNLVCWTTNLVSCHDLLFATFYAMAWIHIAQVHTWKKKQEMRSESVEAQAHPVCNGTLAVIVVKLRHTAVDRRRGLVVRKWSGDCKSDPCSLP